VNGVVTNGPSTITVTDGILNLNGGNAVGATVIVEDTLNIGASQTFDSLTIGAAGVVTLTASAPGAEPGVVAAGEAFSAGGPVQAVPEPGAVGLLAVGILGLLGRRKARKA
jgi:hypothetical protein